MSARSCPRLFQAEAIRDGRLHGAERASFERHATTCGTCAREVAVLGAVADAVRTSAYVPADDLHVRRERTRLLAAFDHDLVAPARASFARLTLAWPAAIAAMALSILVWRARDSDHRTTSVEASRPVIHAEGVASWSRRIDGNREIVTLRHGMLWIHVDHASPARSLLVELPDGELEDTGTTFTVGADGGRTTRVVVSEGSVLLRLRGSPPVAVRNGESWIPQAVPEVDPAGSSAAVPSAPASSASMRGSGIRGARPAAASPEHDASVEFQAAVSALHRGDAREAATAFASFLANHPHDVRAEDAAYLRVIALQRCGDTSGARAAAAKYLERYPTGFRHTEVEALSR